MRRAWDLAAFVGDIGANHIGEILVAHEAQLLRARRIPRARPAADDLLDALVALPVDALHRFLARHFAQRRDHLVHAHRKARQIDHGPVAQLFAIDLASRDQRLDRALRRKDPYARVAIDGTGRALAVQRLADDAAR